jgi:hypothetical protein
MVPVEHIFIPTGFDSNDTVEIVVTGFLPNLCHKVPEAQIVVNGRDVDVNITSLFYHETNPFCPSMVVPFTQTVNLGLMDKGMYNIKVNGKSPWELNDKMEIDESTSNAVDDHHYAYVNYIDKEEASKGEVVLKGYNPSDCFVLDKIDHVSNKNDTYSILPKMKQIRSFCPRKMVPFSYKWKVPNELNERKVLLHVRTMNGNSVNSVYSK